MSEQITFYLNQTEVGSWNRMPPLGVSYFEHKVTLIELIHTLNKHCSDQNCSLLSLKCGVKAYSIVSSLPKLLVTFSLAHDCKQMDVELHVVDAGVPSA